MSTDLRTQLAEYGRYHRTEQQPVDLAEIVAAGDVVAGVPLLTPHRPVEGTHRRGVWAASTAAAAALLLIGGVAWLS